MWVQRFCVGDMLVTLVFGRWRLEDHEFKATPGDIISLRSALLSQMKGRKETRRTFEL